MNRVVECVWFVLLGWILIIGIQPSWAAQIDLGNGLSAQIEGEVKALPEGGWEAAKDTVIVIEAKGNIPKQVLSAYLAGVKFSCDAQGIDEVTGVFCLEIYISGGPHYCIPGKITATRMKISPSEKDTLTFTRKEAKPTLPTAWVSYFQNQWRVKGNTSVEAVHPAQGEQPKTLVSMGGDINEVVLVSDLKTGVSLEEMKGNFWREAFGDLEKKRNAIRNIQLEPNRVGISAYRAFQTEALQGLSKLEEGYRMLQNGSYTDEVLKRMVESGTAIPRLVIGDAHIVCGDTAIIMEPFLNWKGMGRVAVDVAFVTNTTQPAPKPVEFTFTLDDLTGKNIEPTRVRATDADAFVEVLANPQGEWKLRDQFQFDLLAELFFTPGPDKATLDVSLDATGFLVRKSVKVVGQMKLGSIEISKDRFVLNYKPEAPSRTVTGKFNDFMSLRKILSFPDRTKTIGKYRPSNMKEEMFQFIDQAVDRLIDAMYKARIDQIDELTVTLSREDANQTWKITGEVAEAATGKRVQAEHVSSLPQDPLAELWSRVQKGQNATSWLDVDFGFERF